MSDEIIRDDDPFRRWQRCLGVAWGVLNLVYGLYGVLSALFDPKPVVWLAFESISPGNLFLAAWWGLIAAVWLRMGDVCGGIRGWKIVVLLASFVTAGLTDGVLSDVLYAVIGVILIWGASDRIDKIAKKAWAKIKPKPALVPAPVGV
jgi:hypothetical protein